MLTAVMLDYDLGLRLGVSGWVVPPVMLVRDRADHFPVVPWRTGMGDRADHRAVIGGVVLVLVLIVVVALHALHLGHVVIFVLILILIATLLGKRNAA